MDGSNPCSTLAEQCANESASKHLASHKTVTRAPNSNSTENGELQKIWGRLRNSEHFQNQLRAELSWVNWGRSPPFNYQLQTAFWNTDLDSRQKWRETVITATPRRRLIGDALPAEFSADAPLLELVNFPVFASFPFSWREETSEGKVFRSTSTTQNVSINVNVNFYSALSHSASNALK